MFHQRRSAVLVSVTATFCLAAGVLAFSHRSQANDSNLTPFTVTEVTRMFDRNGMVRDVDETTHALRGDGSRVFLRRAVNGSQVGIKTVVNTGSATRTTVDARTESTTTYQLTKDEVARLRSPAACSAQNTEHRVILGFDTIKSIKTFTNGEGEIRGESWLAPALDCYALRSTEVLSKKDGTTRRNEMEATSVVTGEPDARLFEIPSGYTERSPSEVFAEAVHRGVEQRNVRSATADALDEAYQSRRGDRP
ncbi:MAG: hypothetical protein ACRD3T_07410 [Terriglobia bacterium]